MIERPRQQTLPCANGRSCSDVMMSASHDAAGSTDGSWISVERPAGGSSRYRAFKIVIDGQCVGDYDAANSTRSRCRRASTRFG